MIGLLAGFGATGIAAGLALIGTFIDVDVPLIDPSALFLAAPLVLIPFFAGAVLRGSPAIATVTVGAVAGPTAAILLVDASCAANAWAAVGLAALAAYALLITGFAAFVGDLAGAAGWFRRNRRRDLRVLAGFAAIGVVTWILAVPNLFGCPIA